MDQLTLCNLALSRLGTQSTIASLDEVSNEALQCKTFFPQAVDAALFAMDWRFATASVALALQGTPPPQWAFQYAMPADLIRVRRILDPALYAAPASGLLPFQGACRDMAAISAGMPLIPYARGIGRDEYGNSVAVIWSNQPQAWIEYTARVSNPDLWDAGFQHAFSWMLAAEIAMPLTGKGEMQNGAMQGFQQAVAKAQAQDANEQVLGYNIIPEWMSIRGGVNPCNFWGR